jgi:hypothetical protein
VPSTGAPPRACAGSCGARLPTAHPPPSTPAAKALLGLSDIAAAFERKYHAILAEVLAHGLPAAICTIYYPRFPDPDLQKVAVAALAVFNDCIVRAAFAHALPLLDLRFVCTEDGDYADPIEPSAQGGAEDRGRDRGDAGRWLRQRED